MNTHLTGRVFPQLPDGSIGAPLSGAELVFLPEDHSPRRCVSTASDGAYALQLPSGRYYVRVTHADWADFCTTPSYLIVSGANQTRNFTLQAARVTTAIVIRHAEKQDLTSTSQDVPLSSAGELRARALVHALSGACISAIYVTDTVRSRQTAQPLADALMLPPRVYDSPSAAAASVLQDHEGDVSLVVAHSNTVQEVIAALGSTLAVGPVTDSDFDNMFVVSRAGATVNVVNLQYGADTSPTLRKNQVTALTALLVGTGPGGGILPQRLVHVAQGAGVSAIFARTPSEPMVAPLAALLGLTVQPYGPPMLLDLVEQVGHVPPLRTVVISGPWQDLLRLMRLLRVPLAGLALTSADQLAILTCFRTGAIRLVPTRL